MAYTHAMSQKMAHLDKPANMLGNYALLIGDGGGQVSRNVDPHRLRKGGSQTRPALASSFFLAF